MGIVLECYSIDPSQLNTEGKPPDAESVRAAGNPVGSVSINSSSAAAVLTWIEQSPLSSLVEPSNNGYAATVVLPQDLDALIARLGPSNSIDQAATVDAIREASEEAAWRQHALWLGLF